MNRNIGFIGIGNMGRGICFNLIKAGNSLTVFDISAEAMEFFRDKAYLAGSVNEVFDRSEVIYLSLPNSEVVESIVKNFPSENILGKVIVDISTSYPPSTKELYAYVKEHGGDFIDSPLIAGPAEAMNASLDIVVAGDREIVYRYADMFQSYCRNWEYVGESGNGHLMKLAQNWAGLLQAILYAQLYPIIEMHGIAPGKLLDVLNTDFFDNWFFRFYSEKYINENYRMDFALELGLKDLTYMKRLCEDLGVPGFMLDGAIDLCRVSLKENRDQSIAPDMSRVSDTIRQYIASGH